MSLEARLAIGLPADPWARVSLDTSDSRRVASAASAAAEGALVLVVGDRGAGKTLAARRALSGPVAEPQRLDRDRLTMADVAHAIVEQLSDERVRHSNEARAGQARRVLAAQGRRPVLCIDDAHVLHGQTVRGLKRLRELRWRGDGAICGVLLLSQRPLGAVPEVALRTDSVRLAGLSATEAAAALRSALAGCADEDAMEALARRPEAANWLDLRALADRAAEAAAARGARRIELRDVDQGRKPPRPAAPSDGDVMAALRRTERAA